MTIDEKAKKADAIATLLGNLDQSERIEILSYALSHELSTLPEPASTARIEAMVLSLEGARIKRALGAAS
jgi:hypothetical protein